MKAKIDTKTLAAAVQRVGLATMGRTTLPILSSILITAKDGKLILAGTNLDIYATEAVEAKIKTEGATVVSFRLFSTFLQRIGTQEVILTANDTTLKVEGAQAEGIFETLPATEFPPQLFIPPDAGKVECDWSDFIKPLSQVSFAMSDDSSRYVLCGVSLRKTKAGFELAATNCKKLAICNTPADLHSEDAVIPDAAVNVITKNLTDESKVGISIGGGVISIASGSSEIRAKLTEGRFPSYESVVPKDGDKVLSCSRTALIQAVTTTSIFLVEPAIGINIAGKGKELIISCGEKSKSAILGTALEGQPDFNITLNYRHLLETLNIIEGDEVRIECTTDENPALIREGNFKSILVPVVLMK